MQKFNAVLFDLDGTLLDTAPGIYDSLQTTLAHYSIYPVRESLKRHLGPPMRQSLGEYVPAQQLEQALSLYREIYGTTGILNCKPYEGVEKMLHTLRQVGYRIGLATSKPQIYAAQLLKHFGFAPLFDFIGGAQLDTGLDTKASVIRHVLAQPCMEGVRPVMVGDRMHDMEGAQLCGVPAVAVRYGYGTPQEFAPYAPLYAAPDAQALCTYLQQNFCPSGGVSI